MKLAFKRQLQKIKDGIPTQFKLHKKKNKIKGRKRKIFISGVIASDVFLNSVLQESRGFEKEIQQTRTVCERVIYNDSLSSMDRNQDQVILAKSNDPKPSSTRIRSAPKMSKFNGPSRAVSGVNPDRTRPKTVETMPGNYGNPDGNGNGDSGNDNVGDSCPAQSPKKENSPTREIQDHKFAVPSNFNPGKRKITNQFRDDKRLEKKANIAMKNQEVGREVKAAMKKLHNGQRKGIGIGTRHLDKDVFYVRTRKGGRIFFIEYIEYFDEVKIVGIAAKNKNEARVIGLVAEIHNLDVY